LSGNAADVQRLKALFNSREFHPLSAFFVDLTYQPVAIEDNPTLTSKDTEDINTLASLVKLYLRELQDPLVPFESYEDFIGSIRRYQWVM
jgi:hypothetical protein